MVPAENEINRQMEKYRFTVEDICAERHLDSPEKRVDLTWFKDQVFILLQEENDTYQRTVTMCNHAGFIPKSFSMRPAQMLTAYQLATQGNGITLVSDTMIAHGDSSYPIYCYTIADKVAKRDQYLYYRKGSLGSPSVKAFRDFLVHYFATETINK